MNDQIYRAIGEICVTAGVVPQEELALKVLAAYKRGKAGEGTEKVDKEEERLKYLYKKLQELEVAEPYEESRAVNEPEYRKHQILLALARAAELPFVPVYAPARERNVAVVDQAQAKVGKLQALAENPKFQTPWLFIGCKKDVPGCACLVGRWKGCEGDCSVWVTPEQLQLLKEFTLTILALAPPERQELSPSGAVFSPGVR